MTGLRVALVTRRFWPQAGDDERWAADLAEAMRRQGARPTVVTAQWDKTWSTEMNCRGLPLVRLPYSGSRSWAGRRFRRALALWLRTKGRQFDVVLVCDDRDDAATAVEAVRDRPAVVVLRAKPIVGEGSNGRLRRFPWNGMRQSRPPAVDAVVVARDSVTADVARQGFPRERIVAIADGVGELRERDPAQRTASRRTLSEVNLLLTVADAAMLAVYIGPLETGRHLETLVDAWSSLAERSPDSRLWLIGDGPLGPALASRIRRAGLDANVLMTGCFDDPELIHQAADVFVLPDASGPSRSLIEAVAAGLPAVASDSEFSRSLVVPGENGVLVPPGDGDRLVAGALQLFRHPPMPATLAAHALRVREQYSLDNAAAEHLRLFERLLAAKGLVRGEPAPSGKTSA
jgi:glycosyltransferase involved in cell wall biosynthesis